MKGIFNYDSKLKSINLMWSDQELLILAKFAGKLSLKELTKKINAVRGKKRSESRVRNKANNMGYSLRACK